jgi:hypothetical protein
VAVFISDGQTIARLIRNMPEILPLATPAAQQLSGAVPSQYRQGATQRSHATVLSATDQQQVLRGELLAPATPVVLSRKLTA